MAKKSDPVWITEDGRTVHISQMEIGHLKNSLEKTLRQWPYWRVEYIHPLAEELTRRLKLLQK